MNRTIDTFIKNFGHLFRKYNINRNSTKQELQKFIMHANNMGAIDTQEELEGYLQMVEDDRSYSTLLRKLP